MEDIRTSKFYNFFSLFGYIVGSLNIYLFFTIVLNFSFNIFVYLVFSFIFIAVNFVLSAMTYMYIDMQNDVPIRGKAVFSVYGESAYISLFLLPFAYFKLAGFIDGLTIIGLLFATFLSVWIYRILMIKRYTRFGFFNSMIAAFFPHIFFFIIMFVFIIFAGFITYVFFI